MTLLSENCAVEQMGLKIEDQFLARHKTNRNDAVEICYNLIFCELNV